MENLVSYLVFSSVLLSGLYIHYKNANKNYRICLKKEFR